MIEFYVPGQPRPQGSKRHVGHGIMVESSKELGPWREWVALVAHNAMAGRSAFEGAVAVWMNFVLPRPKSCPKRSTPPAIKRPDGDKLARACGDALSGICYRDDAQVIWWHIHKRIAEIGETAGVEIRVEAQGLMSRNSRAPRVLQTRHERDQARARCAPKPDPEAPNANR
jgi:crossover junction endodeoxyribonuclease RusA